MRDLACSPSMEEETGEVARYVTLTLSQAEFDVLTGCRLYLQAKLKRSLTWPEFVLELARQCS